MTIQRQYSLPNCTLTVEGLGDVISLSPTESRSPVSVLINAECRLAGQDQPLSGGREFLDSLVKAVSQYVQELLSGFHDNRSAREETPLVQLHSIDGTTHRLSVHTPASEASPEPSSRDIDLNTVQLFDLMEAIDQLLADSQTLPDLSLNLKPLSRREIAKTEPIAKRVVPAAVGVSSLAAAALAFSFLPVPKIEPPKDLYPVRSTATATPGTSPSPGTSPTTGSSPQASPTTSPSPSPTTAATPNLKQLEANLTSASEITDTAELTKLAKQLREQLEKDWKPDSSIPQDLIYRVGVSKDGALLGYKPINSAALQNVQKTPLLSLVGQQGDRPTTDPLAQFKVAFTSAGGLEVTPWRQVVTSPVSGVTEITASKELEEILPRLRTQIDENWPGTQAVSDELIFKVRVQADGTVVDYSPENDAAGREVEDTPFAKLGKPISDNASDAASSPTEPVALFKVVFKPPNGATEISPWRGWSN
jgi:hypothetical protein